MKNLNFILVILIGSIITVAWRGNQHEEVVFSKETQNQPAFYGASESPASAPNDALTITVNDPVGDSTFWVDVLQMDMRFSNVTGDYRIILKADPAVPFVDDFRININLFNPDVGTTAQNPSFFQDVLNDYDLITPTLQITLTGTNPRLQAWNAGDRVFTNSQGAGNPDGVSYFRSSVGNYPLGEDKIAFQDLAQPTIIMAQSPTDVGLISLSSQNSRAGGPIWLAVVVVLVAGGALFISRRLRLRVSYIHK